MTDQGGGGGGNKREVWREILEKQINPGRPREQQERADLEEEEEEGCEIILR